MASSTYVNGMTFMGRQGNIKLPRKDTAVFTSPTTGHVGAQVSKLKGPAFQLILTKYDEESRLLLIRDAIVAFNGEVVTLHLDGVKYELPQYGGYKFFVSHADVVSEEIIPHASGVYGSTRYDFDPAAKVVAQMMFYAVPA